MRELPEIVLNLTEPLSAYAPSPEFLAVQVRLKTEPGAVIPHGSEYLNDGRMAVTVLLNVLPSGTRFSTLASEYPRIVGALKAQGVRVPHDAVLRLQAYSDVYGDDRG